MSPDAQIDPAGQRLGRNMAGLVLVGLTLAGTLLLSTTGLGAGVSPIVGPLAALQSLISSGVVALVYLASGVGLAGPVARRLAGATGGDGGESGSAGRQSANRWWIQLALGTGGIFWLSHLVGVFGGLSGAPGRWVALAIVATGVVMLVSQLAKELKEKPHLPAAPASSLLGVIGIAVLLCAACNPPGALWRSEAGGFDALSYHLPLAQEWAMSTRLRPLDHDVYSYLPSYYEAGVLHIGAALGAGTLTPGVPSGLLAYDGLGAVAAQMLAALSTIIAAALTGRVASVVLRRVGCRDAIASGAGGLAFAVVVCVPWSVVCGSLAYNEMPLAAMFAGALLVAIDMQLTPGRRWLLAGLLVGLACGFKPTAAFIVAPTIGCLLIAAEPVRTLPKLLALGILGGLIAFGPPLVRNTVASGNPVFPAGTSIFGHGHWSQEQIERFAKGHHESAPLASRAAMLFSTTPDPSSLDTPKQPRGFMHRQWAMVPIAGLFSMAVLLVWVPLRGLAVCLLLGITAACVWWIGFSHAQSRFLLPLVVPFAASIGVLLGMAVLSAARVRAWMLVWPLALAPLAAAGTTLVTFLIQNDRTPNALLGAGAGVLTGEDLRSQWAGMDSAEREKWLAARAPNVAANLLIPPDKTLYLLGGSTPFYYTGKVLYHTTWDTSPLGKAIALHPDDPARWAAALRERGIDYILLDLGELERLRASGWYDPRVTPEAAMRLAREQCEVIGRWDRAGALLLRLTPTPPKPANTGQSA
ncbi:MAG: hypothetical protein ACREJO_01805 [Phycisphaerales bacterium]